MIQPLITHPVKPGKRRLNLSWHRSAVDHGKRSYWAHTSLLDSFGNQRRLEYHIDYSRKRRSYYISTANNPHFPGLWQTGDMEGFKTPAQAMSAASRHAWLVIWMLNHCIQHTECIQGANDAAHEQLSRACLSTASFGQRMPSFHSRAVRFILYGEGHHGEAL